MHPDIFYEGGRDAWKNPKPADFLSDETYAEALTSFMVVCSDVVAIHPEHKTFYLAKRKIHAGKGPWMFGGRRRRFETATEGALRCLKRETTLDLTSERLSPISVIEAYWQYRKLSPEEEGQHDILFLFSFTPTMEELTTIEKNLHTDEYEAYPSGKMIEEFDLARLEAECPNRPLAYYWRKIFE